MVGEPEALVARKRLVLPLSNGVRSRRSFSLSFRLSGSTAADETAELFVIETLGDAKAEGGWRGSRSGEGQRELFADDIDESRFEADGTSRRM